MFKRKLVNLLAILTIAAGSAQLQAQPATDSQCEESWEVECYWHEYTCCVPADHCCAYEPGIGCVILMC